MKVSQRESDTQYVLCMDLCVGVELWSFGEVTKGHCIGGYASCQKWGCMLVKIFLLSKLDRHKKSIIM